MNVNWDALGASAELVGAMAIFISLIYLAVQIRQNTHMITQTMEVTRLSAFERNVQDGNHSRELLLLHPELTQLFLKGCRGLSELREDERFRFSMLLRNLFSSLQGAYVRQLTLAHDPEDFQGTARVLDELIANPGIRDYFEQHAHDWRPEFRALVEQRLSLRDTRENHP